MSSTQHPEHARDESAPVAPAAATPNGAESMDSADVLEVLQEFETGLEAIKSLYKQRQQAMSGLKQREQEITRRQEELERSVGELAGARAELDRQREEIESQRGELSGKAGELERLGREIEQRRGAIDRDFAALSEQREQVEREIAELRGRAEREIGEQRAAADTEIQQRWVEIDQRSSELSARAGELDVKSGALAARGDELDAERGRLDAVQRGLDERAAAVEREKAAVAELEAELNRRAEALAQREEQLGDLGQAAARLREQIEELRGALTQAAGEIASERGRADEQTQRADSIAADLKTALADVERQKQEFAAAERDRSEQSGLAAASQAECESMRGEAARLRELADELDALWAVERGESARLLIVCERLMKEAAEAEQAIGVIKDRARGAMAARDEALEKAEAAELALGEATRRVGQLESRVRELESAAPQAKPALPRQTAAAEARLARRRTRLKNYRSAVKNQAIKIRRASEALGKRYEACEQLLAQRAELAQARVKIVEGERRAQRQKAGTRAAVVALCCAATLVLLGGLSWAVSREVAPARFLATSELAATGRGRDLNAAELAEWQAFHESLLADPRFHTAAAERFKRQGIATLSEPGRVAEMSKTAVTFESMRDGSLLLRLEGEGADRTARELETFTAALASFANAEQQRRIDGGATEVAQPATAGVDPIDNTRTIYAGAIMGGVTVLVFGAAGLIWRKLASAKTAFEQDGHLAAALDEARWVDPRG